MITNRYIQIFYNDKWFLSYVTIDQCNDLCIWYCYKNPFIDSFIDSVYSNRKTWKLFSGHKYFMYLLSTEKIKYLPIEIRKIIWGYLNILSL